MVINRADVCTHTRILRVEQKTRAGRSRLVVDRTVADGEKFSHSSESKNFYCRAITIGVCLIRFAFIFIFLFVTPSGRVGTTFTDFEQTAGFMQIVPVHYSSDIIS